jgi:hypothetical protein
LNQVFEQNRRSKRRNLMKIFISYNNETIEIELNDKKLDYELFKKEIEEKTKVKNEFQILKKNNGEIFYINNNNNNENKINNEETLYLYNIEEELVKKEVNLCGNIIFFNIKIFRNMFCIIK